MCSTGNHAFDRQQQLNIKHKHTIKARTVLYYCIVSYCMEYNFYLSCSAGQGITTKRPENPIMRGSSNNMHDEVDKEALHRALSFQGLSFFRSGGIVAVMVDVKHYNQTKENQFLGIGG